VNGKKAKELRKLAKLATQTSGPTEYVDTVAVTIRNHRRTIRRVKPDTWRSFYKYLKRMLAWA